MPYNKENESTEAIELPWRPTNVHDRCCRATAFNPYFAPDFLRSYGDPILDKYLDLDNLQQAPTVILTKELKEMISDASLSTQLLDATYQSNVLLHLEHKSRPSTAVYIQLLAEVSLTACFHWIAAGRPESGYVPPISLMILVYNGAESWDGLVSYQDIYPDLPPEIFPYMVQFKILAINLRSYNYNNLPGELHTQAYVESLLRATDGTFNEHLPGIMQKIAQSHLNEGWRYDLTRTLASYNMWTTGMPPKQIANTISTAFKRQEGIQMAEKIQNNLFQEWIDIGEKRGEERGEIRGKVEGKIEAILLVLRTRFFRVPPEVSEAISQITDPTALDSHLSHALTCASMKDFTDSLK